MKKILLIQSRENPDAIAAEQRNVAHALQGAGSLDCISAVDDSLPWGDPARLFEKYDGVILGGSSDYDIHGGREEEDRARTTSTGIVARLRAAIDYLRAQERPVLGICFGHQIIAEMYGGSVTHDHSQKKSGTHTVALTDEGKSDPLFAEMPRSFDAQYAHKDSVTTLPRGAVQLADGTACRFSALRYGPSIYTMQFHPELGAAEMIANLNGSSDYLPVGVQAEAIVKNSPEASKLIPLWLERIVA